METQLPLIDCGKAVVMGGKPLHVVCDMEGADYHQHVHLRPWEMVSHNLQVCVDS